MNRNTARKMRLPGLLLPLLALCWVANGQAASFDCAKASTAVEKIICADTGLSKLDDEMQAAFHNTLQHEKETASIRLQQKRWLKERNICLNADCVKHAYEVRLQELAKNSGQKEYLAQKKVSSDFSGQWHIELCDKDTNEECGGFTVYLGIIRK